MSTVLITGHGGYVGSAVIDELAALGHRLIGIDSGWFWGVRNPLGPPPETKLAHARFLDVRDLDVGDFHGVDAVVHLAAVSNDPIGSAYDEATQEINISATRRTAELAKRAGVTRFVFASSTSVYGAAGQDWVDETTSPNPQTAYAVSKVRSEQDLADIASSNFRIACLRFATAHGFSSRLRTDLVVNDFVLAGLTSREVLVLSDGTPWRPLVHVRDMARAVAWGIERNGEGDDFVVTNVGMESENFTVAQIADSVASTLGVPVRYNPGSAVDSRSYRVRFDRWLKLAPTHQPSWGLQRSVPDLYERLKGESDYLHICAQGNAKRLARLKALQESGDLNASLRWA
jgi:nucleoside-diphosphate-sugar epimerase